MNFNQMPFSEKIIKDAIGDGVIEFSNFLTNSRSGAKALELKVYYSDGKRKVIVLYDFGIQVSSKEINVNIVRNREERNKEIFRLYNEENLSQVFLANLFGISQPAVSLIVRNENKKA